MAWNADLNLRIFFLPKTNLEFHLQKPRENFGKYVLKKNGPDIGQNLNSNFKYLECFNKAFLITKI